MKKLFLILISVVLVVGVVVTAGGVFWFVQNQQPVEPTNQEEVSFVIPRGQAVSIIGQRLEEEGFIKNALVFRLLVKKEQLAGKLQAGSFTIKKSMTPLEIAETFTTGSEDQWVTIPEGLRREEIAELFTEFSEFDTEEFLTLTQGKEGYLYPDTYLFPKAATTEFIVSYLTNTFESKTEELQAQIEAEGKSWPETVVLASIVQREAKVPVQMKMVAGILNNRLAINQALQVDATLQYIKGQDKSTGKWWTPPLGVDKELDSPFNTYKVVGIPPTPIANPGFEALDAVVNPTDSEYFFYLHADDGQMYYGVTYQDHLQNIERYLR